MRSLRKNLNILSLIFCLAISASAFGQNEEGELEPMDAPADVAAGEEPPAVDEGSDPLEAEMQAASEPEEPFEGDRDVSSVSSGDEAYEARLARIYTQFGQNETSDEAWKEIAGPRLTETYTLQQGDTLWDVSAQFFGTGYYWPKVWQLNDRLTNPHLIEVGGTLQFNPGSVSRPPSLEIEEGEETQTMASGGSEADGESVSMRGLNEGPMIPPPKSSRSPMLNLPPSFFEWNRSRGGFDKDGFSTEVVRNKAPTENMSKFSEIISDDEWRPVGEIVDVEGGMDTAATYQRVIVALDGGAQSGNRFTAFKNVGNVYDANSGENYGYKIRTTSEIQILSQVPGEPGMYNGMVTSSVLPLKVGDPVVDGARIPRARLGVDGPDSQISARIINGVQGRVYGLHNVVFLNRGSKDGLQVGSVLNVLKNLEVRKQDRALNFYPYPIGKIKVINVSDEVSTAVVVAERSAIMPGDETAYVSSNYTGSRDDSFVESDDEGGGDFSESELEEESEGSEEFEEEEDL